MTDFILRFQNMSDEELIQFYLSLNDYDPAVQKIILDEIQKRNINEETIKNNIRQRTLQEIQHVIHLPEQSSDQIQQAISSGAKCITFQYCISMLVLTFKRNSKTYLIMPEESAFLCGLKYSLISLLFGWWGFPWGPIWTISTIFNNLSGGKDVTEEVGFIVSEDILPAEYKCPKCNIELDLEISERIKGEFRCPNCGEMIQLKKAGYIKNEYATREIDASQYIKQESEPTYGVEEKRIILPYVLIAIAVLSLLFIYYYKSQERQKASTEIPLNSDYISFNSLKKISSELYNPDGSSCKIVRIKEGEASSILKIEKGHYGILITLNKNDLRGDINAQLLEAGFVKANIPDLAHMQIISSLAYKFFVEIGDEVSLQLGQELNSIHYFLNYVIENFYEIKNKNNLTIEYD